MKQELYQGPDISVYQGNVDVKQIRDAGCRRIGIRVGYGRNNVDEKFTRNALACVNLHMPVILYWFSYAYTAEMARREGTYAAAQAAKYWKRCPLAYDCEYDTVNYARKQGVEITRALATDMAVAFLKEVKAAGYIPVLYANRDYLNNYFDLARIRTEVVGVYLWFARYGTPMKGELEAADIWQYTSKGRLAGVAGNVDMNRFYTDFETVAAEIPRENSSRNLNILNFQRAANADGYTDYEGKALEEDGSDGPRTRSVRRKINLTAKASGRGYVAGSTGEVVKWWQRRCNEILSHNQEVDGRYGPRSRAETITLQKKLGLKVDGVARYNSIQAAFYN